MMQASRTSLGSWLALAIGLLAGASLVWFIGPLLSLRGWRPLDSVAARALLIAATLLLPMATALWRRMRLRRLARRAAQQPDALDTVVDQALLRLRARPVDQPGGWRAVWAQLRQAHLTDPLAALPWMLVIGLPGADKRRALAAAGYELPLRSTAEPPCTWCITPRGVLIDVAEPLLNLGQADWLRLLRRLKQARPLQPVSAVLLMLPATDRGGQSPADLAAYAAPLQARLNELIRIAGLMPPLHLAFTACERLAGYPGADAQQRLQATADALGLASPPRQGPAALLDTDATALRRLIDEQVLAPPARPLFAQGWLRRQRWLVRVGYAATVMVAVVLAAGWMISRQQNLALIARQQAQLPTIQAALNAAGPALASNDVSTLLRALDRMQQATELVDDAPWTARLGLFQGDKLKAFADSAYLRLLRDNLAPALLRRLEVRLRLAVTKDDKELAALYDLLRLYLALQQHSRDNNGNLAADLATRGPEPFGLSDLLKPALSTHVAALMAAGGAPALAADTALVNQARQLLSWVSLHVLLMYEMSQRHAAAGRPQLSVKEMVGAADADLFARTSGLPLTDGVATLYTLDGIDRLVAPVLKSGTLNSIRQVLGQTALRGDAATAADEAVRAAALQRYSADYIAAWDELLGDVHLLPLMDLALHDKRVSRPDSPVAALFQAMATQTAPGGRLAALAPAGINTVQVDEHFSALHRLVAGSPSPLEKGLRQLDGLIQSVGSTSVEELQPQIDALPPPLRQLLAAKDILQRPRASPAAAAEAFSDLQRQCQRSAANRYPLVAAAKAEMTLADFAALFGAGSGFDAYFQRWLAPLVDTGKLPWSWRAGSEAQRPVPAAALASFERATRIRELFFRAGGSLPSLQVAMTPRALDGSVTAAELRINGVPRLLRVGQRTEIDWPGQPAMQRISLGAAGATAPDLSVEGPWALLRLLDPLSLLPSNQAERYTAHLQIGGQAAVMEVRVDAVASVGKAELRQFQCPAPTNTQAAATQATQPGSMQAQQTVQAVKKSIQQAIRKQ